MKSLEELTWAEGNRNRIDFAKAAMFLVKAQGDYTNAADLAQRSGASNRVVSCLKAAVPAQVLSSDLGDFGILAAGFVQSLQTTGAFDAVAAAGSVKMPLSNPAFRVNSSVLVGAIAGEGSWQPLTSLEVTPGALVKIFASAIVVVTEELMSAPNAVSLLEGELRRATVASVDRDFLAAMVSGAPSVLASTSMLDDIKAAADVMTLDASARLVLVTTPQRVRRLALAADGDGRRLHAELTISGGRIAGIQVVASSNIPQAGSPLATPAILVDASQVVTSSGELEMDVARSANVQMDTAPAAGAQPTISLWQTNTRGIRLRRRVGYAKVRSTAAAIVDNPQW